ncbi:hypothetical protein P7C70_g2664, partial [Phenoliferia sp. Uapishka_3]
MKEALESRWMSAVERSNVKARAQDTIIHCFEEDGNRIGTRKSWSDAVGSDFCSWLQDLGEQAADSDGGYSSFDDHCDRNRGWRFAIKLLDQKERIRRRARADLRRPCPSSFPTSTSTSTWPDRPASNPSTRLLEQLLLALFPYELLPPELRQVALDAADIFAARGRRGRASGISSFSLQTNRQVIHYGHGTFHRNALAKAVTFFFLRGTTWSPSGIWFGERSFGARTFRLLISLTGGTSGSTCGGNWWETVSGAGEMINARALLWNAENNGSTADPAFSRLPALERLLDVKIYVGSPVSGTCTAERDSLQSFEKAAGKLRDIFEELKGDERLELICRVDRNDQLVKDATDAFEKEPVNGLKLYLSVSQPLISASF